MTTTITRTAQADTITYAVQIDNTTASQLVIDATTRKVINIETGRAHQRQGYARQLWEAANAEAECYHAVEHHRTPAGDAFAHAVGGYTIDDELDYIDECIICTGEMDEDLF